MPPSAVTWRRHVASLGGVYGFRPISDQESKTAPPGQEFQAWRSRCRRYFGGQRVCLCALGNHSTICLCVRDPPLPAPVPDKACSVPQDSDLALTADGPPANMEVRD